MSVKSIVATVTGFLGHHVNDLSNIATALSAVVGAIPMDAQDKSNIQNAITDLETSVENINNFLNSDTVTEPQSGDVVVKESDLVTAVANFFASDAGKEALANAAKGNANA